MKKKYFILVMLLTGILSLAKGYAIDNKQVRSASQDGGGYPGGTPHAIPGVIQAYAFDLGGEGVGYHDLSTELAASNPVRPDVHVGIIPVGFGWDESEYAVSSIQTGEWLAYSIHVEEESPYDLRVVTAGTGAGRMSFLVDGKKVAAVRAVNTGEMDFYEEQYIQLFLSKGDHILKIEMDEGGFNLAMLEFTEAESLAVPVADLLDVVFVETDGPNGAIDISPANNTIHDVGTKQEFPKVYPVISYDPELGKRTAHFSAQDVSSTRGSGAYRVDWVDYSNITTNYFQEGPLPLNAIGQVLDKEFSMEVMFKIDPSAASERNRIYPFSGQQSMGAGLAIEDGNNPVLEWNIVTDNKPRGEGTGGGGGSDVVVQGPQMQKNVWYHAIATYTWDKSENKGKMVLYLNGVKVGEAESEEGFKFKYAATNHTDALAQWFCIGGDARRADPVVPNIHVNGDYDNWAERIFEGDIAVARIYSWALSDIDAYYLDMANRPSSQGYAPPKHVIPGVIQAYEFDLGGEGVGYHDLSTELATNNPVRPDVHVNIIPVEFGWDNSDYAVSSIEAGEWLAYTIHVAKEGLYDLSIVTAGTGSGKMSLLLDGKKRAAVKAMNTGELDFYETQYTQMFLSEGEHILKIEMDEGGFNLAMLEFTEAESLELPVADLFDIEFVETEGPNGAIDISPLRNPVYDVDTKKGWDKMYPVVSYDSELGKRTAHFTLQELSSTRGSAAYRVDYADYSNITPTYYEEGPLPLNTIGQALDKEFSMEVMFKIDPSPASERRRIYPFSGTQSMGAGIQIEEGTDPRITWYMETDNKPRGEGSGGSGGIVVKAEGPVMDKDVWVHAIGTYIWDKSENKGKMVLYMNGEKVAEAESEVGYKFKHAAANHADALAQWFCIGGDSRATNPIVPAVNVNGTEWDPEGTENWAERIFEGDIAVARIYSWALSDVDAFYLDLGNRLSGLDIRVPESIQSGVVYAHNNTLYFKNVRNASSVAVYNLMGQKVAGDIISGDKTISLPSKGIYIVKIQDAGKSYSVKVLNK